MDIQKNLIKCGLEWAKNLKIKDFRFGLGYSCVELDSGAMGVAWTPTSDAGSCTHVEKAGGIAGSAAEEILTWLNSDQPLQRTAGLAVFNALNTGRKLDLKSEEAISLLDIKQDEHVVMVGYFAPVVPAIKACGCRFEVVELNPEKPGVISPEQGFKALAECDVAIITSTSIINGTCNELLQALTRNRAAVMLGPSTPMCAEAFQGSRITQLSGSIVTEPEQIKCIVSEGGGTRLLKKHLRFASVMVR